MFKQLKMHHLLITQGYMVKCQASEKAEGGRTLGAIAWESSDTLTRVRPFMQ